MQAGEGHKSSMARVIQAQQLVLYIHTHPMLRMLHIYLTNEHQCTVMATLRITCMLHVSEHKGIGGRGKLVTWLCEVEWSMNHCTLEGNRVISHT